MKKIEKKLSKSDELIMKDSQRKNVSVLVNWCGPYLGPRKDNLEHSISLRIYWSNAMKGKVGVQTLRPADYSSQQREYLALD